VTAVFVAVALFALLGMAALAVDVGMLMKVRTDAQRAADAAALAGAQEFRDNPDPAAAKYDAALKALEYASRNYAGWKYVDTSAAIFMDSGNNRIANSPEAYVQVLTDEQKVRVFIRPLPTSTFFGGLFRLPYVAITVKAAAQAVEAGSGKCVKPFAIPDIWNDVDNDTDPANPLNRLPDIRASRVGEIQARSGNSIHRPVTATPASRTPATRTALNGPDTAARGATIPITGMPTTAPIGFTMTTSAGRSRSRCRIRRTRRHPGSFIPGRCRTTAATRTRMGDRTPTTGRSGTSGTFRTAIRCR